MRTSRGGPSGSSGSGVAAAGGRRSGIAPKRAVTIRSSASSDSLPATASAMRAGE
jgi:hypothetical protein